MWCKRPCVTDVVVAYARRSSPGAPPTVGEHRGLSCSVVVVPFVALIAVATSMAALGRTRQPRPERRRRGSWSRATSASRSAAVHSRAKPARPPACSGRTTEPPSAAIRASWPSCAGRSGSRGRPRSTRTPATPVRIVPCTGRSARRARRVCRERSELDRMLLRLRLERGVAVVRDRGRCCAAVAPRRPREARTARGERRLVARRRDDEHAGRQPNRLRAALRSAVTSRRSRVRWRRCAPSGSSRSASTRRRISGTSSPGGRSSPGGVSPACRSGSRGSSRRPTPPAGARAGVSPAARSA